MPGHVPDPHNLQAAQASQPAPIISVDRHCIGCGYNLRGLRLGIKCPECGMPSKMPEGIDDPLSLMPMSVIVAFIRGCWVASICVVALIVIVMCDRFPVWDRSISMMLLAGIALLWVGAVMWLTPAFTLPQAAIRGYSRAGKLRRVARHLQWGWVLAGTCAALEVAFANPAGAAGELLSWGRWLGFLCGMAGIVTLSVLLERLSEWARDDAAEKMFNWATWGLPIATPLLFVDSLPVGARLVFLAVWFALACTFPYGLIALSQSVTLSVLHAKEHEGRVQRRDERSQQYQQQVVKTIEQMDAARARK